MSRVNLGHITLNTRLDGDGEDWIVLSNSLGTNHRMWDEQIGVLTKRYRVLRYDTRGHGKSDAPIGPYSFDQLIQDAIALLDHFEIERATWMGLSMGAMTGMGLALGHPERFSRFVLADARADAPEFFHDMWHKRIATIQAGGLEAIIEDVLAMWFSAEWRAMHPKRLTDMRAMVLATDQLGYIANCQALLGLDYLRQLSGIATPCLYIGGDEDKVAMPDVMQELADRTPGARYVSIPGAGHIANINNPLAFNAAISGFLGL